MYLVTANYYKNFTDYYGDDRVIETSIPLFVVETELEAGWWKDKLNYEYSYGDKLDPWWFGAKFFSYEKLHDGFSWDMHLNFSNEAYQHGPSYRPSDWRLRFPYEQASES